MKLSKKILLENVTKKINQSNYFLEQMKLKEQEGDVEGFYYVYSAFLSSSRSALLYFETHRKNFYKRRIKTITLIDKFRKERNLDVHENPIESLNVGESIVFLEIEVPGENPTSINNLKDNNTDVTNKYEFYFKNETNLNDNNRIVVLAENYLNQIIQLKGKLNN